MKFSLGLGVVSLGLVLFAASGCSDSGSTTPPDSEASKSAANASMELDKQNAEANKAALKK